MLPNLSQLSTTGAPEKRLRGGGQPSGFPEDVVEYLAELADLRRPDQVLIVYRNSYELDGECHHDAYATLTFAELAQKGSPAAKALLYAFQRRLAKAKDNKDNKTIDIYLNREMHGLGDLLTDNEFPMGDGYDFAGRYGNVTEDGLYDIDALNEWEEEARVETLIAINKPLFELNKEFLAKALSDRETWEKNQDFLLPIDVDAIEWESEDVEAKWESILRFFEAFNEDYDVTYTQDDVVPLVKWKTLKQITFQSLTPWAQFVYKPASRLLEQQRKKATNQLPFWVPRIRIYAGGL